MTNPVPGAAASAAAPRSSFIGDLRTVLASSGFRKLYATRLISQTGDGVFNAGLGAYVFFNSASFPDPAAAATSFAVLYLPYSLIGPFAGVFTDRWSRRHIVLLSALLRAVSDDELVMGNSVGPTSGTVVAFIGGIVGLGVRLMTGPGPVGSAVILLAAGLCYLGSAVSATRIGRDSLGPDLPPGD